jgi:hypothetical protein
MLRKNREKRRKEEREKREERREKREERDQRRERERERESEREDKSTTEKNTTNESFKKCPAGGRFAHTWNSTTNPQTRRLCMQKTPSSTQQGSDIHYH